jgi:hypothetical protein
MIDNENFNGLTREDFEDRDFTEDYIKGVYSVPCRECNGNKVVLTPLDPMPEQYEKEFGMYINMKLDELESEAYDRYWAKLSGD